MHGGSGIQVLRNTVYVPMEIPTYPALILYLCCTDVSKECFEPEPVHFLKLKNKKKYFLSVFQAFPLAENGQKMCRMKGFNYKLFVSPLYCNRKKFILLRQIFNNTTFVPFAHVINEYLFGPQHSSICLPHYLFLFLGEIEWNHLGKNIRICKVSAITLRWPQRIVWQSTRRLISQYQ